MEKSGFVACPQCGYVDPPDGDLPPAAIYRPWHLRGRESVRAYVESLGAETREWLLALYVDADLNLLAVDTIARGGLADVIVNFPRILVRGHQYKATAFILVHNHPSGDAQPSDTDIRTTVRLRRTSEDMDLPLLDHVIVAGDDMRSVGLW